MRSTNHSFWILIATITIINLSQADQAPKIGLKDNRTSSKRIVKRRLNQDDHLLDDATDDSDGTSFFFLPPKTIRGTANHYLSRYIQDSIVGGEGEIPSIESDEMKQSTVNNDRSTSILPNGRPGRMRVRRVEHSSPSVSDHSIESEYTFDDLIVPNSPSAKRLSVGANVTSNANQRSRSSSFGTRRRVKVQTDPNREPGNDPISHFMEVDMKENEDEDKELLDPGSSEIRDTIEPRGGQQFRQTLRNSESPVGSINSGLSQDPYSRFKNGDFEEPLSRPQIGASSSDSDSVGATRQSNPQYRPNYEHYESRGGSSSGGRGRESIVGGGLESGFTGINPGSSSSPSSSSRHHPSLTRSTDNSDPVRGIRARYFRPQTVGDYRQSNHAYVNGNRLPTILIPNQDIRQQLPRPYYVTTQPPLLTSSPIYTTFSDLALSGLAGYQSNPASDYELHSQPQPQRPGRVEVVRRPSSHYRTMIADHLIDEDEGGYNVRGLTTVSPSLPPPPTRPSTTTTTTTPSTPVSRPQPISRDYNYGYEVDRARQPNYDYPDQPINHHNPRAPHQQNHQRGNANRHSNDRSHRNQYPQATATTTSTTTTPKPVQHHQNNKIDRANDRGQAPNYRSDYDSPSMTATIAPPNGPDGSFSGPDSGFRIRPAGRPGGRRRRKRPRVPLGSNQGTGNESNRQSTTTTTTTTTTTSVPPPAPYYYDDYEGNEDYEYDYHTTTTTTTIRPRRKGRRGQGGRGRGQRTSTTPSTTTTTTPATTTRTLSPGYKHRPDKRVIDYMADPNFPHELKGADLTDYPFYISLPTDIHFNCEGRHDGYYASIEHKCQVYHHCALGHRYDFLCPNYTLFDQTTFTCRFVNTVDCLKSENHFNRNDDLYVQTTEKPEDGDKSHSKNEKERNKRDEKETIKAEESSRTDKFSTIFTQSTPINRTIDALDGDSGEQKGETKGRRSRKKEI